ncbi:MAG: putative transposase, partial [Planktomarina sp.]
MWGYVGCEGLQERHLYSRTNFKLNRAAALAEWRQLLSA